MASRSEDEIEKRQQLSCSVKAASTALSLPQKGDHIPGHRCNDAGTCRYPTAELNEGLALPRSAHSPRPHVYYNLAVSVGSNREAFVNKDIFT